MNNKKFRLFLDLLDKYMEPVYGYTIHIATPYDYGVIFSISELDASGHRSDPYILVIELKKGILSFKNSELSDCIYDYIEEHDMTKEEADKFMEECYRIIKNVE